VGTQVNCKFYFNVSVTPHAIRFFSRPEAGVNVSFYSAPQWQLNVNRSIVVLWIKMR